MTQQDAVDLRLKKLYTLAYSRIHEHVGKSGENLAADTAIYCANLRMDIALGRMDQETSEAIRTDRFQPLKERFSRIGLDISSLTE